MPAQPPAPVPANVAVPVGAGVLPVVSMQHNLFSRGNDAPQLQQHPVVTAGSVPLLPAPSSSPLLMVNAAAPPPAAVHPGSSTTVTPTSTHHVQTAAPRLDVSEYLDPPLPAATLLEGTTPVPLAVLPVVEEPARKPAGNPSTHRPLHSPALGQRLR
jgi:hypothetical protein